MRYVVVKGNNSLSLSLAKSIAAYNHSASGLSWLTLHESWNLEWYSGTRLSKESLCTVPYFNNIVTKHRL